MKRAAVRAGARTAAVTWGYAELLIPQGYQKLRPARSALEVSRR